MKLENQINSTPAGKSREIKITENTSRGKRLKPKQTVSPQDQIVLSPKAGKSSPRHKPVYLKSAPSLKTSASEVKNWTVLCYLAGDNNLEEQMTRDLKTLEAQGSSSDMNILAQLDRGAHPSINYQSKPGMIRYYLEKSNDENRITSPVLKDLGQANAADPKVLKDFLSFGMKNYPAQNYLIFVYGHGGGVGGFITDDGPGKQRDIIPLPEFKKTVKAAQAEAGVDKNRVVLALESCQMSQVETAYEFKDLAARMLTTQSSTCWDFPAALAREGAENYSLEDMSRQLFEQGKKLSYASTLSLLNLQKVPELKKPVVDFIRAVKNSPVPQDKIKRILEVQSRPNYGPATPICHYASDFSDSAQLIVKDPQIKDPKLKKAAYQLKKALDKVIEQAFVNPKNENPKNSNGLGILTNNDPRALQKKNYHELAFDRDTGWGEFMTSYARDVELKPGDLKSPALKSPRLVFLASIARKMLQNPEFDKRDIAETKKTIKRVRNNASLSQSEKRNEAFYAAYRLPSFQTLRRAADQKLDIAKSGGDPAQDQQVKKLIISTLSSLAMQGGGSPSALHDIVKVKLLVFSALDGEISSKTLAASARKVLETKLNLPPRRKNYLASDLVLTFANAANNEQITDLKNRFGDDDLGFLKAVARLEG